MKNSKKSKLEIKRYHYSLQSLIPLILIVFLVPLTVRLKILFVPEAGRIFANGQENVGDFFSYYKMYLFLLFVSIASVVFLYKLISNENIMVKKSKIYYPMITYSSLVLLSTIFAKHKDVVLIGFWERYEGMYVLLGYMVVLFIAINLIDNERQIKYLLLSLGLSSIVMSSVGLSQIAGRDIFQTSFGKLIMVPARFKELAESINFAFKNTIYGTLYNPNYVGLYMSVVFTLSTTILILSKDKYIKTFSGVVTSLSLINLLGSGSRTGMISIALYGFLIIIFFRKSIINKWKQAIIIFISLLIIILGLNSLRDNYVFNRIKSIGAGVSKAKVSNLKDIIMEDNYARILIDDYELRMIYENGQVVFVNKYDNLIEVIQDANEVNFKEEPYSNHYIEVVNYKDDAVLQTHLLTNRGMVKLNLVVDRRGNFSILGVYGEYADANKYPSWGFKGSENFASNRGYIWSRSFPLLKDTTFIGYGPDTYALHFPHDDYLGKLQSNFRLDVLVDKPHNIYLQTAINTGILSLVALLSIFIMYIVSSVKIYFNKKEYNNLLESAGISIFFAVCIYLMMGFLNDSIVGVASVFWVLLGTGISINMKLENERTKSINQP